MLIIGCDYHPSVQQIAFVDSETGESGERRLLHQDGEAERFYRDLKLRGVSVRLGIEATGHARWFERLLAELGFELWIGNPSEIKAARVPEAENDRLDAQLLLKLLVEDRFPRIWVSSPGNRDLRQLLWHRHRLVQIRTRVMNQPQAVAMNEGVRRKGALWSKSGRARLESFLLLPWASRRRQDFLDVLDRLNPTIDELSTAEQEAKKRPEVLLAERHSSRRTMDECTIRRGDRVEVTGGMRYGKCSASPISPPLDDYGQLQPSITQVFLLYQISVRSRSYCVKRNKTLAAIV